MIGPATSAYGLSRPGPATPTPDHALPGPAPPTRSQMNITIHNIQ